MTSWKRKTCSSTNHSAWLRYKKEKASAYLSMHASADLEPGAGQLCRGFGPWGTSLLDTIRICLQQSSPRCRPDAEEDDWLGKQQPLPGGEPPPPPPLSLTANAPSSATLRL
uniref:Uncharacterized protein n=1 Tax=Zea mays TaxID=4577 RepID=A0A804LXV3_MAIZE